MFAIIASLCVLLFAIGCELLPVLVQGRRRHQPRAARAARAHSAVAVAARAALEAPRAARVAARASRPSMRAHVALAASPVQSGRHRLASPAGRDRPQPPRDRKRGRARARHTTAWPEAFPRAATSKAGEGREPFHSLRSTVGGTTGRPWSGSSFARR